MHGAHQQKEEDRDGLSAVSEAFLLGGGNEFETALLHRKRAAERKQQKLLGVCLSLPLRSCYDCSFVVSHITDRAEELAAKQAEREASCLKQLGIDPSKGRISIRPREA